MRFEVTHVTVYDWGAPVPVADCRLRLTPIDRPRQRVHATALTFDPVPDHEAPEHDWYGNAVTRIAFRAPHSQLTIRASATVTVEPLAALDPDRSPPWEEIARRAAQSTGLAAADPIH
ncbi:MAG: hypothetical protein GX458_14975, partial [Phyllobacteriaceae bacterium]|nr:hypothetical protein [Phyllobacteriaceae bacterium]